MTNIDIHKTRPKTPIGLWAIIGLLVFFSIASFNGYGLSINGTSEKIITPIASLVMAIGLYFRLGVFRFLTVIISSSFVLVLLVLVAFSIDVYLHVPFMNAFVILGVFVPLFLALFFFWIVSFLTSKKTKELFGTKPTKITNYYRKALFSIFALFLVILTVMILTKSFTPISTAMIKTFTPIGDDESKVYISKKSKTFTQDEMVVLDLGKSLPVKGTDTSLCFLVGHGKGEDTDNIIKSVLGDAHDQKILIEGNVTSQEGQVYPLNSRLSQSWSMSTFSMNSGDVSLCAQIKFSEECCGIMKKSDRKKEVIIPTAIKEIKFKPLADIKTLSVYWMTSDRNENMRDVWKEADKRNKQSPFYPRALYKELLERYPGSQIQGKTVFETQSIKLHNNKNFQAWKNAEDKMNFVMEQIKEGILQDEEVTGVKISLSDDALHIIPKNADQAKDQSITIDKTFIHSCSARCFGNNMPWDAIFILPEPAYTIEINDGLEFIEWCWKNRIPVLFRKDRDDWYYNANPLPVLDDESQFASLEEYKKRINKVCAGY